jgi:2-keto-4-pentenoate hydratase/2-oxohepta-3-ene-1,7-dioic acid hydratase in catechol pathway
VRLLAPCQPGKIVALWNNFHALAAKLGSPVPPEPLWFLKSTTAVIGPGDTIRRPAHFDGKVIFEGEIGIVIGRRASGVTEAEAPAHILGYTCVNDVTAVDLLKKDATFDQWSRAKSFDTFCPLGPAIATGLDPAVLEVRVVLNGEERQRYPVADMVFPPARLVALLSRDVTLEPGDVIACGTSVGVGTMKPGSAVTVAIAGIGELANRYE